MRLSHLRCMYLEGSLLGRSVIPRGPNNDDKIAWLKQSAGPAASPPLAELQGARRRAKAPRFVMKTVTPTAG